MKYSEAVAWLFTQFPSYQLIGSAAYKPTLENTQQLLSFIDHPERGLQFVHVAGSNGKGSTCSMIASALTEAGYKVGLFTSPHLEDYTERIRINGVQIDKKSVVDFVERMQNEALVIEPSFFEMTFALALDYFQKESCDICVIETGLGGRLDATNVITPLLSVITNISLEHTQILGDSLEKIAVEKAGIIKTGVPIVTSEQQPSIVELFKEIASEKNANFYEIDPLDKIPVSFPLLGAYQETNYRLANRALNLLTQVGFPTTQEAREKGLEHLSLNTGLKARLQILSTEPLTILDVSHNPAGISATMETINKLNHGDLHIVYGTSSDKDISSILMEFPLASHLYLTQFSNPRSATILQLEEVISEFPFRSVCTFTHAREALNQAQTTAKQTDTILIIGSFFLVSDFL